MAQEKETRVIAPGASIALIYREIRSTGKLPPERGSLGLCESSLEYREFAFHLVCGLDAFGIERHRVADVGLTRRKVLHVRHPVDLRAPSRFRVYGISSTAARLHALP